MREQVACQVHFSLFRCLQSSNFIIIGCLKWAFFLHASMHEAHNLHGRRWGLELLWAFSTVAAHHLYLVSGLMFLCVSCHQVLTECTSHTDKPPCLSSQTGWALRGEGGYNHVFIFWSFNSKSVTKCPLIYLKLPLLALILSISQTSCYFVHVFVFIYRVCNRETPWAIELW